MTLQEELVHTALALPPEKQQKLLEFARALEGERKAPLRSPEGLLADLGVHITEEDIDEMRREAWAHFPREF